MTEMNWIQVDQDLEWCMLFFEVMMVVNPQTNSLVLLAIKQFKDIWLLDWLRKKLTEKKVSAKEISPQRLLLHTLQIVDYSHKVSTSLAMQIILGPFDLLGFYTNEGKILWFKPLSDRISGPWASSYDWWRGLSPQLPLYPLREQAKDAEAKYRRLFLTLGWWITLRPNYVQCPKR